MKIIKLNAIDSTNSYLKEHSRNNALTDETIVVAKTQVNGRGQMGTTWQSKSGQSLTFSILKRFQNLQIEQQTMITFATSIGIKNALEKLQIPSVCIKWPNDIMSYNNKLCGILIENQIEGFGITASIIGIGLNVNETEFSELPQATSMKLASGITYHLDEVLQTVSEAILHQLSLIETDKNYLLKSTYEDFLYKREKVSAFQLLEGETFNGIIKGVNAIGHLLVETEDEVIKAFELKQLKMLF